MRISLVNVPFASIEYPSLALGILRTKVSADFPESVIEVVQGNLDFVDWASENAQLTFNEYHLCSTSFFSGYSEWIFSSALYKDPEWRTYEFVKFMREKVPDQLLAAVKRLHESAPDFTSELAQRIVASRPDIVGFTSTFSQHTAALATARAVKELLPEIVTVMGGGNCDGPQGAATHRNFPFIDFVVSGEGESPFSQLLAALNSGDDMADIPGLCWRRPDGMPVANAPSKSALAPADLVTPDYDGYYDHHRRSLASTWTEPKLVMESSRGCWWGEKHHCTFCGLNGSLMQYRSISPDRFVGQILDLVEKHRILDVTVTDNIMDMSYLSSALPRLKEADYDLRINYEIKANLRREQLEMLKSAGVVSVQPGVESLSSRVLKLMDKGVGGCQNIRILRDAETVGINIAWIYLYGFPGENDEDYERIIEQLPALHHLGPASSVMRITIQRFSPYFNRPELGFSDLRPAYYYSLIYDLPEKELADLSYIFDAPHKGIGPELGGRLEETMDRWRENYPKSRLTWCDLIDEVVLVNTRPGFSWRVMRITNAGDVMLFRLLDQPNTLASLERKLADSGFTVATGEIAATLEEWKKLGLIFEDAGMLIQVAPSSSNQDLKRMMDRQAGGSQPEVPIVPALA
ncbi:MAG: RiPP maturation radical SAM C-methyltransferase [Frankia sp.]